MSKENVPTAGQNQGDWLLASFVKLANDLEVNIGVTLIVGGSVISGLIISGRQFLQAVGTTMDQALPAEASKGAFHGHFEKLAESIYGKPAGGNPSGEPTYIHLKNARVFSPAPGANPTEVPGLHWRVRLDEVQAFTLGTVVE